TVSRHFRNIAVNEKETLTYFIYMVDLFQLQVNTLRRYKRHYKLQTRPGLNKAQLAETVSRHFRNIAVNEKETLTYFIYMVKSSKTRMEPKTDSSKHLD
ncbi:hypothetical protein CRUP_032700, partial [Coryphaenoides rupestris]